MNALDISRWIWDFYLAASVLLAAALLVGVWVCQPARRMALAWATVGGLLALMLLTMIPSWSRIALLPPAPPEPAWADKLEPDLGPAIQQTPFAAAEPSAPQVTSEGVVTTAATPIVVIDWGILTSGALLIGSGIVVVWLLVGAWQVRRLRARAEAVPQEVADLLTDLALQQRVELGMLAELPVPVAVGLRSPCILLPRTLATSASREQLRSVLAHELAHIEHRDLWLLSAMRFLMIVLWPHPLFWLLRRQIRRDQEVLADTAAAALSSRADYAEQLVALARSALETRVPRLASSVGLWEGRSQLTARIKLLLDEQLTILQSCSRRWRVGAMFALGTLAVGLSLVTLTPAELVEEGQATEKASEETEQGPTFSLSRPNEISGRVVDEAGKPLVGVTVDAWSWYPGNETETDDKGYFVLKDLEDEDRGGIEVQFSKTGFCPAYFVTMPIGTKDWKIPLNSRTFIEGQVTGPDGKPVPQAKVRASRGPFENPIVTIGEVWTDTEADADGKYRLYLEPDTYNVQIHIPNVGLARHKNAVLKDGDQRKFDIQLQQGPTFRAKVVDSETGEPVEGIRLSNWMQKGIEGVSGEDGMLVIDNMLPGMFEFVVSTTSTAPYDGLAGEYARWWSAEGADEFSRKQEFAPPEIQRNIDELKFNITENMQPVTIFVEKAAKIEGNVVDPDGNPVAGATIAPTRTGTGNSLTGDTRYGVRTDSQGKFLIRLPASGKAKYHLIAHDGDYQEWRTWANGIGEPLQTKPGQSIEDVALTLSRPCVVRGLVVDDEGNPQEGREVTLQSIDNMDNRYYMPTAKTNAKGEFELRHVRQGKHQLQVSPNGVDLKLIETDPTRPVEGIKLTLGPEPTGRFIPAAPAAETETSQPAGVLEANQSRSGDDNWRVMVDLDQELDKHRQANQIHGLCVDESGQPLPGAQVTVYAIRFDGSAHEPVPIASTVSNAQGEFHFKDVVDIEQEFSGGLPEPTQPGGNFVTVVSRLAGRVPGYAQGGPASEVARSGKAEVLKMPPAQILKGRIVDNKQRPVSGAHLRVVQNGHLPGLPKDINSATTDANGEFVIDDHAAYDAEQAAQGYRDPNAEELGFNTWQKFVEVAHPNFARKRVGDFKIPGSLEVTLSPGAIITGRVMTEETGNGPTTAAGGVVSLQRYLSPEETERGETQYMTTKADQLGEFRFDSLPSGTYSLNATLASWVTNGIEKFDVATGKDLIVPDIVMTRGGTVRVQLVDELTGKPAKLQKPAKGFILSQPRPTQPARIMGGDSGQVEFSTAGVAERQLPPGQYILVANIMGSDGQSYWQLRDVAAIREQLRIDKVYDVVEGEVLAIEMQKVGEEQRMSNATGFLRSVEPIAETTQPELEPTPASAGNNRRYLPITPAGQRTIDRESYENGVFVPNPQAVPRR